MWIVRIRRMSGAVNVVMVIKRIILIHFMDAWIF